MTARGVPGRRAAGSRPQRATGLRTVSLRRRVTASSLLVLAAVLLVVGVLTDVLVAAQTRSDLQSRLEGRAATAVTLAGQGVRGAELVRRLDTPGVRVTLTTTGGTVYTSGPGFGPDGPGFGPGGPGLGPGGPDRGGPPGARGAGRAGDRVVRATLPDGSALVLTGDSDQVTAAQQRLRRILFALSVGGLVAAGLVTLLTTRLALAPLDAMTGLARSITRGDRGRRLAPARTDTELGRAAAAFDTMLDALEGAEATARASEARTRRFVADAAHELRTPLAGVRAAAEAALDPGLPAPDRDRLHLLLLRDTQRAARLVDDLLALARIDAGIELHPVPVDLLELARTEAERAGLLAPRLTVEVTGEAAVVRGDPQRLGQVLANLLDNARRHTPDGGTITVAVASRGTERSAGGTSIGTERSAGGTSIGTERSAGRTGTGTVTVTDTGPGVPEADRERIFERLVRLDDARSADDGGAGLGLAIARGIARAHGGELRCVDPAGPAAAAVVRADADRAGVGRGAAFRLDLPVTPP